MKSSETRRPCILVADDQPDVLEALRFLIKGEGYQAVSVNSPGAVIGEVESRDFDAVLMDLNYTRDTTSGQEGMELLNRIQLLDTTLPVIVMTAWGSVELAVEAMRRGARDFIQKPWDNARLSAILKTQIELGRAVGPGERRGAGKRGARFHPEAVGQRAAFGDPQDADRTGARAAPGAAPGSGESRAARRAFSATDRPIGGHASRAGRDLAGGPVGRQRVHHRRKRHGQRTGGSDAALGFDALHAPPGDGEYRRSGGGRV